ncbi:hypothetical protein [Mycoplasmopsis edwardii]|uniref:Uncharacterized protein n=1 Tax=Mycoplasmopsis edwardii TaxID=53558 RepID=A0ACD4PI23_9BACT|nr:hypothetical protein [Mycoplasmopsis edwardii]WBP84332.1 hypothetical protein Me_995_000312 [Mycoplasmopsis edwardii]
MKRKKLILTLLPLTFIPTTIISCSQQEQPKVEENKKIAREDKYSPNENFINKLNNQTSDNISVEFNKLNDFISYDVLKFEEGSKITSSNLPTEVLTFDKNGYSEMKQVTWEINDSINASNDLEIFGRVEGFVDKKAKITLKTSQSENFSKSELSLLDDKLQLNIAKSTKDGNWRNSDIRKLVDRTESSESISSNWNNWPVFNKPQNNIIVFNSESFVNVSSIKFVFAKPGWAEISNNTTPSEIRIKYSNDGENWFEVKDQDKVFQNDFGPLGNHHEWAGSSKTFTINFNTTKTKWISFTWKAAKNENNQDLGIALTDIKWFGPYSSDETNNEINFNNRINSIRIGDQSFRINSNEETFIVSNLDQEMTFDHNASKVQKELIFKNENKKIYKLIAINDLNSKEIYTITLKKEN